MRQRRRTRDAAVSMSRSKPVNASYVYGPRDEEPRDRPSTDAAAGGICESSEGTCENSLRGDVRELTKRGRARTHSEGTCENSLRGSIRSVSLRPVTIELVLIKWAAWQRTRRAGLQQRTLVCPRVLKPPSC
jgi:hypothetical protein